MSRVGVRLAVLVVSTVVFFALAEGVYRLMRPAVGGTSLTATGEQLHSDYGVYFEDAERRPVTLGQAKDRGLTVPVDGLPRERFAFAPNSVHFMCYRQKDGQPYFDDRGCVEHRFNSRGIRDREELCEPKPAGQSRIVCIGDSFTFGWGVPFEDAWTQRVERALRSTVDDGIRTVNCGAAGALYVDEYWLALRDRFHAFEPDVVLISLCLNDLLPTNTSLCQHNREEDLSWMRRNVRLWRDLTQPYPMADRLHLDPSIYAPLVDVLLAMDPVNLPAFAPWATETGATVETFWGGGGPQAALQAARDWCRERKVAFGVAIWPFFQGLGPNETYPFRRIHELVGAFCAEQDIAFLDLLPAFEGKQSTPDLWVSPADMHGDVEAQTRATPAIAAFLQARLDEAGR